MSEVLARLLNRSIRKTLIACGVIVRTSAVFAMFLYLALAFSQKLEYELYHQFRADF